MLNEYIVIPSSHTPLLGAEADQQFGLITVTADKILSLWDDSPKKQDCKQI